MKKRADMQFTLELKAAAAPGGGGGGASGGTSEQHAISRNNGSTQRVECYVGGDPKFHHEDQLEFWKASIEDCESYV